jgi:hypothetical protein
MNGKLSTTASSLSESKTLSTIARPSASVADQLEQLFLITLSRPPTATEAKRFAAYVEAGGPEKDRKAALADVFWALLNSTEFAVNH